MSEPIHLVHAETNDDYTCYSPRHAEGLVLSGAYRHSGEAPEQAATENLTAIRGIGPARERQLQRVGIATVAHLARYPDHPSVLATALNVTEAQVQEWIDHAKRLS